MANKKHNDLMPDRYVQIDVKEVTDKYAICNLYTGLSCVEIVMKRNDYEHLIRKGFFIRNGETMDSANILNTSDSYFPAD